MKKLLLKTVAALVMVGLAMSTVGAPRAEAKKSIIKAILKPRTTKTRTVYRTRTVVRTPARKKTAVKKAAKPSKTKVAKPAKAKAPAATAVKSKGKVRTARRRYYFRKWHNGRYHIYYTTRPRAGRRYHRMSYYR